MAFTHPRLGGAFFNPTQSYNKISIALTRELVPCVHELFN